MSADTTAARTTAEAYLARLAARGVEHVFANPGTDFASIIEALATRGAPAPKFITVPHENLAMGMAHGYYRTCGKPAAVMVHVTVGTANTICGLMNAARDNVPILLAAGRTPLTETGHIASRNRSIHWGQEAFDQGGMLREFVKWDYELRGGQPAEAVVDRALDIAMSAPRGPVYLTLPREVLANPAASPRRDTIRPQGAAPAAPAPDAIADVARLIARAEFPLLVTAAAGRTPEGFAALAALADAFALPVVQSEASDVSLPSRHAMNAGFEVAPLLPKADVIVVLECAVPWMPSAVMPRRDAKIVHIGADPLFGRYPFRDHEADLVVTGEPVAALTMLHAALADEMKRGGNGVEARRVAFARHREEADAKRKKLLDTARGQRPIHSAWLADCVNRHKAKDAIVVSELGVSPAFIDFEMPRSYIGNMLAGGLGMGLGAALGAKLAAPEREVIVAVGDGSYMFGNPLPFHYVARAENLPTLTIVANNQSWHAVRSATLHVYPDGAAAKANTMPLTKLEPAPDYEKMIATCGGYGERVDDPAALDDAIARGLDKVRAGTPVLLNVLTQGRV